MPAKTADDILREAEDKMKKSIKALENELTTIRTGRASPAILDRIQVDYYGSPSPIKALATVSVPDSRSLMIQPFDRKMLSEIERAIQKSDLGINPSSDGQVLRLALPPLSQDRRKDLVKSVKKMGEENKIAIRNCRRDALDHVKHLEKDGVSTDEIKKHQERLQKITDRYTTEVDKHLEAKEAEIMEV